MRCTITSSDGNDAARCCTLSLPSGAAINTPTMLVCTRRGSAHNLTPDLLEQLQPEAQALQLNALHFLGQESVLQQYPGTAREFLVVHPGFAMVATARDPCVYEYTGAMRQSTDSWVSVSTTNGAKAVTPEGYMALMAALQPDIYVALSDEVPSESRADRAAASVKRTADWLQRCLAVPQPPAAAVFAAVQGAQYLPERRRCAQAVAAHAARVSGFVIAGLGTGESRQLRREIIAAVLRELPAEKARAASCVGTPEEVLDAVGQGVDLFDMAYIAGVTAAGHALCFPLSPEAEAADGGEAAAGADPALDGRDDTKLNLWAVAHRSDRSALVAGCSCIACTAHSRAYIHHLLHTHEMTAQVLLEAHNTLHYLRFFAALRSAIAGGTFERYREWVAERKRRWLMGE